MVFSSDTPARSHPAGVFRFYVFKACYSQSFMIFAAQLNIIMLTLKYREEPILIEDIARIRKGLTTDCSKNSDELFEIIKSTMKHPDRLELILSVMDVTKEKWEELARNTPIMDVIRRALFIRWMSDNFSVSPYNNFKDIDNEYQWLFDTEFEFLCANIHEGLITKEDYFTAHKCKLFIPQVLIDFINKH